MCVCMSVFKFLLIIQISTDYKTWEDMCVYVCDRERQFVRACTYVCIQIFTYYSHFY